MHTFDVQGVCGNALVDVDALDSTAGLASVVARAVHDCGNRSVKVSILTHVSRVLATKFQRGVDETRLCNGLVHSAAACHGAREGHECHSGVRDHLRHTSRTFCEHFGKHRLNITKRSGEPLQ